MKFLTWESFEGLLDHALAVVEDSGPFRRPTKSIKVILNLFVVTNLPLPVSALPPASIDDDVPF